MPFYSYTLLAPLLPRYFDNGKRDLFNATCDVPGVGVFKIAVVGKPSAAELIRSELVGCDGNYTKAEATSEAQLVDHLIAAISLSTGHQVDRVRIGQDTIWVGSQGDPDGTPNLSVSLSEFQADPINPTRIATLFQETIEHRHLFKLVRDTQQPMVPLPYRYLSAYKVLELEFKIKKKWPDFPSLLAPFETEFRALNISNKSLENYIHAIRDKCAHLSTSDLQRDAEQDVEDENLQKLFDILRRAMFAHLATKFPLEITHPPYLKGLAIVPPDQKQRVAIARDRDVAEQLEESAIQWENESKTRSRTTADAFLEYAKQTRVIVEALKVEIHEKNDD